MSFPSIWKVIPWSPKYEIRRVSENTAEVRRVRYTRLAVQYNKENGEHSVRLNGKSVSVELLVEQLFLTKDAWAFSKEIEAMKLEYPYLADQLDESYSFSPGERARLLIIKGIDLVCEWSSNNPCSIGSIYALVHDRYLWNCLDDDTHPDFLQSPSKRVDGGQGCPRCFIARQNDCGMKLMDKSRESELLIQTFFTEAGIKAIHTGDDSGYIFDLVAIFEDEIPRGLQVKFMGDPRGSGKYSAFCKSRVNKEYPPDTLMVGINPTHGLYLLAYAGDLIDLPKKMRIPTWVGTSSKYARFLYRDLIEFKKALVDMARNSTCVSTVTDARSVRYQKEYDMKAALRKLMVVYEPDTAYGDIDCFLSESKVASQLKFTGVKRGEIFAVNNLHEHDGRDTMVPYNEDARFHVLVIQTSDSDKDFLVIPKAVLLRDGFLKTKYYPGKHCISLPSLNNKDHHYAMYWNRWDLLTQLDYQPSRDIYDKIAQCYISTGHQACIDRSNLRSLTMVVNETAIKVSKGSTADRYSVCKSRTSTDNTLYEADEIPLVFIFVARSGDFWVVPGAVLRDDRSICQGSGFVTITVTTAWALPYKNVICWPEY